MTIDPSTSAPLETYRGTAAEMIDAILERTYDGVALWRLTRLGALADPSVVRDRVATRHGLPRSSAAAGRARHRRSILKGPPE